MFSHWRTSGSRRLLVGCCLLALLGALLYPTLQVNAQETDGRIVVVSSMVDQFPLIQLLFKVYDDQGNFVEDLSAETLQVIEDAVPYSMLGLELLDPGVQFSIVFNPAPIYANYSGGRTNFEMIMAALQEWVSEQNARTPHDFSLISPDGVLDSHLTVPSEWSQSLESYQPDLINAMPNLSSLAGALSLAADAPPKENMERAVLFITPVLSEQQLTAVPDIIDRAVELKVHIFTWLVGTTLISSTQTAQVMQEMADSTGGKVFYFSGSEQLPSLDTYFQPLRYLYRGSYISAINTSGVHDVIVQMAVDDQVIASDPVDVSVQVSPPNPIFLSPPVTISRTWTTEELDEEEILTPHTQTLNCIIEYPDGYTRPIVVSRLYVDDELVVEHTESPFDQFEWNLDAYTEPQTHTIRVEVQDSLGLTGSSMDVLVDVQIGEKSASWLTNNRLIVGVAVFGAAAVMLTVLVLAGGRFVPFQSKKKVPYDPVTQPIHHRQQAVPAKSIVKTQPLNTSPYIAPQTPARLVPLSPQTEPLPIRPIPLNQPEITFGSDPEQSICVLASSSVNGLHARIYRTGEGEFILADFGSTSGTWINYAPVSIRGTHLENGDLVQIGDLYFRFELITPRAFTPPAAS